MASIFLIRHAEPEMRGVLLGQMDSPLSETGRERAAQVLGGMHVPVAWTSPLLRARETAALLDARQVVEVPGLREIDHGEWTGRTWTEIEVKWADLAMRKSADWLGVTAPGGEEWTTFLDRVRAAWQGIREGPPDSAVVAHQGVNAALAHLIDGRDPLAFTQEYGEVIRLEYD
jgi:broad specificity phosphatase PhoE